MNSLERQLRDDLSGLRQGPSPFVRTAVFENLQEKMPSRPQRGAGRQLALLAAAVLLALFLGDGTPDQPTPLPIPSLAPVARVVPPLAKLSRDAFRASIDVPLLQTVERCAEGLIQASQFVQRTVLEPWGR